jgi:hypothetical protein
MELNQTITLDVSGPGIVVHSPFAAAHIREGEDYLSANYMDEEQVQPHIQRGTLVGFGTGSPGTFILHLRGGYPSEETLDAADCTLRLGLQVKDRTVCLRDLYDLMEWAAECPPGQTVEMDDGFYHITLHSDRPPSGLLGDNQEIWMYFQPLTEMPALYPKGVPTLC